MLIVVVVVETGVSAKCNVILLLSFVATLFIITINGTSIIDFANEFRTLIVSLGCSDLVN